MESRFYQGPYQLQRPAECVPFSPDISSLHFFFWNFHHENIYTDDFKAVKELKNVVVGELGCSHSQIVDKSLTDQGTIRLPAVTVRKRTQMGSFTLNAADGQPKVGKTDDIVNLLLPFHWQSNYI